MSSDHDPAALLTNLSVLEMLHDGLPYGVAIFDADLRLIYADPGWPPSLRAPGTAFAEFFPGAEDILVAARHGMELGEIVRVSGHVVQDGDQESFWDITLAPLKTGEDVIGVKCVAQDVTARVLGERAATARERLAAFRLDVSRALANSGEVGVVLQACAEAVVRHADAAFARIWVFDEAEDIYRLRASAGMYTRLDGTYSRIPADWIRQKIFGGYSAQVALDILKTHNVREPEWAAANGLVAWANHPLMVEGRIIGFLSLFARQNFSPDILDELGAVSDAIAQFLERANAETALREREVLFRSVFEAAAEGLLVSDLESGRILEANPVVCAMYGCSHDELCQMHRTDLIHPDSRPELAGYVATIQEGRSARVQVTGIRKDGTTFPASAQGSPILYGGQPAVLGIIRDITREQEAQEELERRVAERTRELSTLLDISRRISVMSELDPLLQVIFDQMGHLVDYESAAIGLAEGDTYTTVAVRRDEAGRQSRDPLGTQIGIDRRQFFWRELAAGRALFTPDISGDDEVARAFRTLVGDRLQTMYAHVCSLLAVPLIVANEFIGAMFISSVKQDRYQQHDIDLVAAIANQIAVAIENARLFGQARGIAALEERQRLARELHDSVSQALFGISLGAETARTMLARDPERTATAIDYVLQLARGGMAEMRALIFELRPESLEQEGLVAALEKQAAAAGARHGIEVELALPTEPDLPIAIKEALYRVAQEAMHNTARHAEASRILLRLEELGATLTMDITDDGRGFDPAAEFPGHLGLVSMRERVARFGGDIEIASRPGEGTRVHVTIPRPADDERREDHAGSRTAG